MLFSSLVFLYLFLPITLLGYYLLRGKARNYWLLLCSLIFFAWGGVSNTAILIVSLIANYFFGKGIESARTAARKKRITTVGVSFNVLLLVVFKYANFLTQNFSDLGKALGAESEFVTDIALPVGISFYTFHCVSYLIDLYRGKMKAEQNFFDLSLYVAMFSQLVAGPIIRYSDVGAQIHSRPHTIDRFVEGIVRFSVGLGKKVLIANKLAAVADSLFALNYDSCGSNNAWLAVFCYGFQIYYDFAGYSDMAIGLGKMFGFDFKENFNYPYTATSVREFWRRWHISLSTFFRDYVYIPLGGSKGSRARTYLNLFFVFLLTGFWHGANWTFVLWGLLHGALMIVERLGFEKFVLQRIPFAGQMYAVFVVFVAWVLFRIPSIDKAVEFYKMLFSTHGGELQSEIFYLKFSPEFMLVSVIAIFGAFGGFRSIEKAMSSNSSTQFIYLRTLVRLCFVIGTLFLSTAYLISGTYNPFIYFQF